MICPSKYKIPLLGAFDPNKLPITNEDFYDGIHLHRKGMEKIFKSIDFEIFESKK